MEQGWKRVLTNRLPHLHFMRKIDVSDLHPELVVSLEFLYQIFIPQISFRIVK